MANHKEFKIGGLSVLFPCKPYPSQFSMMDKIIRGIQRQQNCLLESPTGSGKSLALLCSALAWQAQEHAKQQEEIAKQASNNKGGACCCSCHCNDAQPPPVQANTHDATTTSSATTATVGAVCATSTSYSSTTTSKVADDDSDEEFKPLTRFRSAGKSSMVTRRKRCKPLSIEYEESPSPSSVSASPVEDANMAAANTTSTSLSAYVAVTPCSQCSCGKDDKTAVRKVPKIYFGTRTHKQIAQIVRELRKTAYHDVNMTILASREHTCIHPEVSCIPNKNEGCQNLVKEVGCRLKDRVLKYQSQHAIKSMGLASAWDLEDMVSLMRNKKACPYFLTRGLKDQSDLIICPYNYLVDPLIRESMDISLKDQIVLLDEAHNIEDAAREAASQSFSHEQIQRALQNMDELMERNVNVADISKLRQMCHKLDCFIDENSSSLTQVDFEQSYRLWSGFEIVAQLNQLDLGAEKFQQLQGTLEKLKAAEMEARTNNPEQDQQGALSSATGSLLESIFLIMKYIYKDNMKHAEDYRASIVKSIRYMPADHNGSWLNSRKHFRGRRTVPVEVFTLNFWCMNPAVGFADFGLCRSVILTSGTLSPMDSFQSELGLPFPIILEANHVIKDSQVWVGTIGEGPDGTSLQAVYRNMETFGFQDQLGQLILEVCKKVPKGVLCFFPSYKTLEKMSNRWKTTGLWNRLEAEKCVFSEPRGSDKVDFEHIMLAFANAVGRGHRDEDGERESSTNGALLFAVCRGKVSEGMDFADNFARAVITVGIPYPNFKDIQVDLKRKYNDKYQVSRRLLSGHLWYEIQAFRALNQALGRCIRHRRDWGALIIVDDRFVKNTNKYTNGLSKWVRQKLKVYRKCLDMLGSLSDFTASHLEEQQHEESMDASLTSTPLTPVSQPGQYDSSRGPLHDVSNIKSPLVTSTPHHKIGNPSNASDLCVKMDSTPNDSFTEPKQERCSLGSGPLFESKATYVRGSVHPPAVSGTSHSGSVGVTASGLAGSSSSIGASTAFIPVKSNVQEVSMSAGQDRVILVPISLAAGQSSVTQTPTVSLMYDSRTPVLNVATVTKGGRVTLSTSAANTGVAVTSAQVPAAKTGVAQLSTAPASNPVAKIALVAAPPTGTSGLDPSMTMMFVPFKDPNLPPTMLVLPSASPTQYLLPVPAQFQQAVRQQFLPVPPMIQRIVMAPTLEQANQLFLSRLQGTLSQSAKIVHALWSGNDQKTALAATPQQTAATAVGPQKTTVSPGVSSMAVVSPKVPASANTPQPILNVLAVQSATAGSPSLFDDTPPSQSPCSMVKSLLTGNIFTSPAKTGSETAGQLPAVQVLPQASKTDMQTAVICVDVASNHSGQNAGKETQVVVPKGNKKQLFRKTPSKDTVGSGTESATDKVLSASASVSVPAGNPTGEGNAENTDQAEEDTESLGDSVRVERRVRMSKRRSLSVGTRDPKKGRTSDIMDDIDQESSMQTMKCATCGFLLLDGVKTTDYEKRDTMPSFLKGITSKTTPEVLYFCGASVTQRLKVTDSTTENTRRQSWLGGLEARVQLMHCPSCPTSTVLGARVTLSDSKTSTSTGQMWIYSHMVTMDMPEEK